MEYEVLYRDGSNDNVTRPSMALAYIEPCDYDDLEKAMTSKPINEAVSASMIYERINPDTITWLNENNVDYSISSKSSQKKVKREEVEEQIWGQFVGETELILYGDILKFHFKHKNDAILFKLRWVNI